MFKLDYYEGIVRYLKYFFILNVITSLFKSSNFDYFQVYMK